MGAAHLLSVMVFMPATLMGLLATGWNAFLFVISTVEAFRLEGDDSSYAFDAAYKHVVYFSIALLVTLILAWLSCCCYYGLFQG